MSNRKELKINCRSAKDLALYNKVEAFAEDNCMSKAAAQRFLINTGFASMEAKTQAITVKAKREGR